jgi:hypothetical protein
MDPQDLHQAGIAVGAIAALGLVFAVATPWLPMIRRLPVAERPRGIRRARRSGVGLVILAALVGTGLAILNAAWPTQPAVAAPAHHPKARAAR